MKYKTPSQIHAESMSDPEYSAAYEAEESSEQLQETLATWRKEAGLTSAQVAERMGIKAPTISRIEKNASRMSIQTLIRYARACGVNSKFSRFNDKGREFQVPYDGNLTRPGGFRFCTRHLPGAHTLIPLTCPTAEKAAPRGAK